MIRVIGVGLLSVAASVPGFLVSDKLIKRKKYLIELSALAMNIGNRIQNGGESLDVILAKESSGHLSFLKNIDLKLLGSTEETKKFINSFGISDSDSAVAADFFKSLGTSDAVTERKHCEYYAKRFEIMAEDAERELKEKGRLYRSLFMFLGAAVFIILI